MRLRLPRLTVRRIMLLAVVVALMLVGWIEWTGRRARAIRGYDRHGRIEHEAALNVEDYLHQIRRTKGEPTWPGPLSVMAAKTGLPEGALEAAARRDLTPAERRLLAEHEATSREWMELGHYPRTPIGSQSLKRLSNLGQMLEPGWLMRALREEADNRHLRKLYEHAINRPWVAVPPEPSAGGF